MNRFEAVIIDIASEGVLHIVTFAFGNTALRMMSLELGEEVRVGSRVVLTIKSTYIALAKAFEGMVSYTNLIPAHIIQVEDGKLLSSIKLETNGFMLESIITTESSKRMQLQRGDAVQLLVKASELSIVEVIDE